MPRKGSWLWLQNRCGLDHCGLVRSPLGSMRRGAVSTLLQRCGLNEGGSHKKKPHTQDHEDDEENNKQTLNFYVPPFLHYGRIQQWAGFWRASATPGRSPHIEGNGFTIFMKSFPSARNFASFFALPTFECASAVRPFGASLTRHSLGPWSFGY